MNKKELEEYINQGNEIEFIYNNKKFSITYGEFNGKEMISFCEFNKETTEVKTVEELLEVKRYGISVEQMLLECKEKNIWIF